MSSNVQTISASSPSICIPRVFDNITRDFIGKTFDGLLGGNYVQSIDFVQKVDDKGAKFKRVFIHFNSWPTRNPQIVAVREKLLAGGEVKVMYDDPWFWKCSASKVSRPVPRDEKTKTTQERRAPYIISDDAPRERSCRSPSPRRRSPSPRRHERTERYELQRQHDYCREYRRDYQQKPHYDRYRPEPINVPHPRSHSEQKEESSLLQTPPRRQRINYVPPGVPVKFKKNFKVVESEERPTSILQRATETKLPESPEIKPLDTEPVLEA